MNLLRAFVNSTHVCIGGNISKRTLHHITFARSIVQWVQKERHDDFRMDCIDFRMEISLRIDSWPAIEPKPDSERAVHVGEHPVNRVEKKRSKVSNRPPETSLRGWSLSWANST